MERCHQVAVWETRRTVKHSLRQENDGVVGVEGLYTFFKNVCKHGTTVLGSEAFSSFISS